MPVTLLRRIAKRQPVNLSANQNSRPQKGGGGAPQASAHSSLGFFCMLQTTCLVLGSIKINFMFTPKSIFHIFSDLFDHLNRASHFKFIKGTRGFIRSSFKSGAFHV